MPVVIEDTYCDYVSPCVEDYPILTHPQAPIFGTASEQFDPDEFPLVIDQLISEINSENFQATEAVRELLRQLGFVNLWFFLKYIAGSMGTYDRLNADLHREMCNFRQSPYAMAPGARASGWLPRGHCKSRVWTHGASLWEIIRNPNIRIRIVNAVVDKAEQFVQVVLNNLKFNDLLLWLYPEYAIPRGQAKVIVPCRQYAPEPNLKAGGATAAAEGDHHDLLGIDDLIGVDDLDIERAGNINMERKNRWWDTNTLALLDDIGNSRIFVPTTLYTIDDPYHKYIMSSMCRLLGYQDQDYLEKVTPDGEWTVYYRQILEHGEPIFPESFPKAKVIQLLSSRDDWTKMSQYYNKPQKAGSVEFIDYEIKRCHLFKDSDDRFIVSREGDPAKDEPETVYLDLADLDVCGAFDPAYTDKGISAKTSRTAICFWAMDWDENVYLLWGTAEYLNIIEARKRVLEGASGLEGYVRLFGMEANGPQKGQVLDLEDTAIRNGVYLPLLALPTGGDKVARIRQGVGRFLISERVYATPQAQQFLQEEKDLFPQSKYRMDFLDATERAFSILDRPLTPYEREEGLAREEELVSDFTRNATTGY